MEDIDLPEASRDLRSERSTFGILLYTLVLAKSPIGQTISTLRLRLPVRFLSTTFLAAREFLRKEQTSRLSMDSILSLFPCLSPSCAAARLQALQPPPTAKFSPPKQPRLWDFPPPRSHTLSCSRFVSCHQSVPSLSVHSCWLQQMRSQYDNGPYHIVRMASRQPIESTHQTSMTTPEGSRLLQSRI